MLAYFYILPESFYHNKHFSLNQLEEKVKYLSEDIQLINEYSGENKILVNYSDIYSVSFFETYTIEDFLCYPEKVKNIFDRDALNSLIQIFHKAADTSYTVEDIKYAAKLHDSNYCHGIIAFHTVETMPDEIQLIYGRISWYKFRRYFLGLYPDRLTFIDECRSYFPNLYFHERNKQTVLGILDNFAKSILWHLAALNDVFYTYRDRPFDNESEKYRAFTTECHLPSDAASKDNNDSKVNLTFYFENDHHDNVEVTCYPHLRLSKSDNVGDSKFYHNRIYFHEGIETIQKKRILIGHIGLHL